MRPHWMTRRWWSREAIWVRLHDEDGRRYTWRDITPVSLLFAGLSILLTAQAIRLVGA